MKEQVPQAGLISLMEFLDSKGIKKGICTRNFEYVTPIHHHALSHRSPQPSTPVTHLLETHLPGHIDSFAPIITRDFRPPKPSPAGILHIAHNWGLTEKSSIPETPPVARPLPLIMVGDSIDDMIAGHEAGAATVLLRSEGKEELERDPRTHLVISRYVLHPRA